MKMQLFSQIQSTEKMSTAKKTNYLNSKFLFIIIIFSICITSVQSCGPGRGFGKPRRPRKLTPLVFKQHIPNVSENTLGASGLQENKITREDPRFKDLVPNYNKDIIFKDEEGTGADRLMSQRCKEKLNTLAVSVMNQWPGVRLRVTEGWDEEYHHAPDSLHYEGRAVDITTSDRDRSKLGMLARLAVEAGFDWVFYESRQHIHCSVKSDSSQVSHSSGCFTGASTVLTSTGERRKLKELRLGERVQSVDPAGHVVFSEVIMFLDRDLNKTLQFMSIETEGGAIINVTPSHLLMAWLPHANKIKYIYADKLEENNFLLVNINNNLEPRKILKIKTIISNGLFAPLTEHGTIVIDSIAASCYALVDSQSLAHNTFMPVRLITSLSKLFNFNNSNKNNQFRESKQNGIHWYAKTLYKIKDYVLPSNWIHH